MKKGVRKAMLLVLTLLLVSLNVFAEFEPIVKDIRSYDWEKIRERTNLTEKEENDFAAILVKDIQAHEYVYDGKGLALYSLAHRIIRVNNDEGITYFNRIYIPTGNIEEIILLKARSISPTGQILDLENDDFKEIKDEDENNNFKIFAVEGLVPGSEVEYLYISKDNLSYFGRDLFQLTIPSKHIHFELISPSNLVFASKGYNGFPNIVERTTNDRKILGASMNDVQELKEEEFTFIHANRMRVEFKLTKDVSQGDKTLLTWDDAAQHVYSNIYQITKKEKASIGKVLKEIKLSKKDSEVDKIKKIEDFVKTNFLIQEMYQTQFYQLESVIENRYGNKTGIVKLFANLLFYGGVNHELVLTSSRDVVKFDKDFESWSYLADYLVYFPSTGQFLSPEHLEYRYGMVPYLNTHNYGLFVKPVTFGKYNSAKSELKFIPASSHSENYDNLNIDLEFDDKSGKAKIHLTREMGGYSGIFIQPYYAFLQEDKKRLIVEELIKMSAEDAQIKSIEVENGESNLSILKHPFIIKAEVESASLFEKAGSKYLFKFGKTIGPQTELYQDNKRQNDVENDFNRSYSRQIIINVPNNYSITNLDDIRMDVFFEKDGEKIFSFKSDYKIEGSKIVAQVDEYYKEIECSKEHFEEFRKVINAAADFNKITLVFERKEQL